MKRLFALLNTKDKSKRQLKKELWESFKKYNKAGKLDSDNKKRKHDADNQTN